MNGADAAVALVRGDVTMACAFGGPIDRMRTVGKPLMTGAEQEAVGINTFDIVSATDSFAKEHPDLLKKFLAVTEAANAAYAADPDAALDTIARRPAWTAPATKEMLACSPSRRPRSSSGRTGSAAGCRRRPRGSRTSWSSQGKLDKALDDYSAFVDPSFLQ